MSEPTEIVDSISGTVTPGYDDLDRLRSETTPQGAASYIYDAAGRRTSMTVAGQPVVGYTYDVANRLTQIAQGASAVGFSYDSASRRSALTLPNGVTVAYSFDAASQLTGLTYSLGQTTLGNLTYAYDTAGRRTSVGGSFARTGLPLAVSSTNYNANNQLTQWGTATLTYDLNGNLTGDGVNNYSWDARNQLASIAASGGGTIATFQYDAFGRRASKTVVGTTTSFLYDGVNAVQELSGSTPTANLLTGGVDEFFSRTDSTGTFYPLTDALGSTVALTDATGAVQTQYTYEPFGNTTVSGPASNNAFQYTGRENDGTGLYYNRARYYSPGYQRFISEDPIGFNGGINVYAYTFDSPTNYSDAGGQQVALPVAIPCLMDPVCAGLLVAVATEPWWGPPLVNFATDAYNAARGYADRKADRSSRKCKNCNPCDPPVGTISYRADTDPVSRPHRGVPAPHWHLSVMLQDPNDCHCYWHPIPDNRGGFGGGAPPAGAVPKGPEGGGGFAN